MALRKRMTGLLSKRGSASKSKGSSFERKVCKELSMWMSKGTRDDLFWRSAMSGGRATVKFKKGGKNQTQAGDISAIDPLGERLTSIFMVECKAYKDLNFRGMFNYGITEGIHRFWEEARNAAELAGRLPLLVAKQNNVDPVIVLSRHGVTRLRLMPMITANADHVAHYPHLDAYVFWMARFLTKAKQPS